MAGPTTLYQTGVHGSRPAASAGCVLYSCTTHSKVYKSDGSAWSDWITIPTGASVATDAIWDAAGDLVQGTGADTGAKLSAGVAGQFLKSAGPAAANVWASRELDYVASSASVNVTATAAASATTIVTGSAVSYDGSTAVVIEFFCPDANWGGSGAAGDLFILYLYDGSSEIGWAAIFANQVAATAARQAVYGSVRLTPSNASHTYSWRGTVTNAGRPIGMSGGAGGSGNRNAMSIRITRAL